MNKTKAFIITLSVLIVIVVILIYNKSRMAAESKTDILTSIPVSVMTATKQSISETRSLVGTITANNDVAIVSETQGRVTAVLAEVGQYKPAGSVIVQVDDELKKANLATAETNYEKAKKDLERFETLFKETAATDQQLEGARLAAKAAEAQYIVAKRQYNDTKITTPISGIITSRPVDVGTYVQNGMPVANVVDISKLKVKLNVAERDVFRLKVGDPVEVATDVYPGVKFAGQIATISAKGDDAHTYPVEVHLSNPKDHPLKAGMFGRVTFTSISGGDKLTIPREALVGSMKNAQVFVVDGSVAHLRDIVVESEHGTELTVLGGLKEGDTIVVNGQNNLKDNVAVTIIK
jgi:RND family efflux transporter MFP subunit